MLTYFLSALAGLVYTDLVGYFSHKLLHSGRIKFLYRLHMEHHITNYPPHDLRSATYRETKQPKILGAGPEWALPIGLTMLATAAAMLFFGVGWGVMVAFFGAAVLYALVAYSWLHYQFHLEYPRFFMLAPPRVSDWFFRANDLHDAHHRNMKKNYGIGSYWLDKLFKTYGE